MSSGTWPWCTLGSGTVAAQMLLWAQDHVTWTMQQWSTIPFTDESRVIVAGAGEGSVMQRSTWSPGLGLAEDVC
ncbi:hypothetical protein DNTS_029773 [Danionella cerebrum]|uniref:Uncharacterized protein n=1 Tax=Danionella cerebrum TaxID=2873325 RepID=A0A553QQN8_9TELE|nr:hypothetical protein DNTS_029773 [Danionella translucida]